MSHFKLNVVQNTGYSLNKYVCMNFYIRIGVYHSCIQLWKLMALQYSEIYGAILGLLSGLWSKWNIEGKYYSTKMILTMVIFVIGAIKLLTMNINILSRNKKQLTIKWSKISLLQICMECMCVKRKGIMTICNAKVMYFFTSVYGFFPRRWDHVFHVRTKRMTNLSMI